MIYSSRAQPLEILWAIVTDDSPKYITMLGARRIDNEHLLGSFYFIGSIMVYAPAVNGRYSCFTDEEIKLRNMSPAQL